MLACGLSQPTLALAACSHGIGQRARPCAAALQRRRQRQQGAATATAALRQQQQQQQPPEQLPRTQRAQSSWEAEPLSGSSSSSPLATAPSPSPSPAAAAAAALPLAALLAAAGPAAAFEWSQLGELGELGGLYGEPMNALSLPTWAIHVSSVLEWIVAMGLMWRYGEVSGNPRWKGLAWGMLPALGSAMCACTWHFFYNSPDLQFLVALQAGLTVVANFTCWYAAWRIYRWAQEQEQGAA